MPYVTILLILSWAASLCGITGSFLVAFKRSYHAMWVWLFSNTVWIGVSVSRSDWPAAAMFIVFLLSTMIGVVNLRPKQPASGALPCKCGKLSCGQDDSAAN